VFPRRKRSRLNCRLKEKALVNKIMLIPTFAEINKDWIKAEDSGLEVKEQIISFKFVT